MFLIIMLAATTTTAATIVTDDAATRITALSPRLLRIEPRGPNGFEDDPTFSVVGRDTFKPLTLKRVDNHTFATSAYSIKLRPTPAAPTCAAPAEDTDVNNAVRSVKHPIGARVKDVAECCALCDADETCTGWVHSDHGLAIVGPNCWPLAWYSSLKPGTAHRTFGCAQRGGCAKPSFEVHAPDGTLLYDSATPPPSGVAPNLLHWPAPGGAATAAAKSYALMDYPRFRVPPWGPAPIPANVTVPPELKATHGFDFRNNVYGARVCVTGVHSLPS